MTKQIETIKIYNASSQMIPLQLREAGANFFHEMQVRLMPKQQVELPKSYIMEEQINNLKARGILRLV